MEDSRRFRSINLSVVVLLLNAIFVAMFWSAMAAEDTTCVPTLVPCTKFLNQSKAQTQTHAQAESQNQTQTQTLKECCTALASVLKKDPQCLCDLVTGDFMRQAGIDLSQAMLLPSRCSLSVHPDRCGHEKPSGSSQGPTVASVTASSSASSTSGRFVRVLAAAVAAAISAFISNGKIGFRKLNR